MKKQNKPRLGRKLFSILTAMMMVVNGIGIGAFAEEPHVNNYETEDSDFASADKRADYLGDDEFKVTLRVEGKEEEEKTPLDFVFVLDTSGSMNQRGGKDKLTPAKAAINLFMNTLVEGASDPDIQFGLVTYASDIGTTIALTNNKADMSSALLGLSASGGTFTQAGLEKAATMIAPGPNKYIILLSDGAPTYSREVTGLGTTTSPIQKYGYPTSGYTGDYGSHIANGFGNKVGSGGDFKLQNQSVTLTPAVLGQKWVKHGSQSNSTMPNYDGSYIGQKVYVSYTRYWEWEEYVITPAEVLNIQDHGFATISSARGLMSQGYHIIGLGIELDGATDGIGAQGSEDVMRALSTEYFDVSDVASLATTLKGIASSLIASIQDGRLVDPISNCYEFIGFESMVTSEGLSPEPIYSENAGKIDITGITLAQDQFFELTYKLRMKDECKDGEFHEMNGTTTLYQNPNDNKGMDINVPEGRLDRPIIPEPGIELTKTVMPSVYHYEGQVITYTFTVTNNGNIALEPTVNDPMLGITRDIGALDPGESYSFEEDYVITAADLGKDSITNIASVSASVPGNEEGLTDTASATIEKGSDVDQIIVYKINSATEEPLEGATFRLYGAMDDGDGGYMRDPDNYIEAVTDENGKVIFQGEFLYDHDWDLFLEESFVAFFLEEVSAPAGFIRDAEIKEIHMEKVCLFEGIIYPEGEDQVIPYSEPEAVLFTEGEEDGPEATLDYEDEYKEVEDENMDGQKSEEEEFETLGGGEDPVDDGREDEDENEGEGDQGLDQTSEQDINDDDGDNMDGEAQGEPQPQALVLEDGEGEPEGRLVCLEYLLASTSIVVENRPIDPDPDPEPETPTIPDEPTPTTGGGGTPQSPVRPDPETVTIPDETPPLAEPEEPIEEVIPEEEVPLAEPVPEEEILDEEVPLATVPKTGIGYTDYSRVISTTYLVNLDMMIEEEKKKK